MLKNKKDFNDFEEMVTAHRKVLKSLIEKDGDFETLEAVEINNGFGKQLTYMKLKLEAYKLTKETPTRKELFLPHKKENK